MEIPLQITFRGVSHSEALDAYVRDRAQKLGTFHDRIIGCRVAIEAPHQHAKSGRHFRVRIDLTIPGRELVVSRAPEDTRENEDAYAAVDRAFDEAVRVLQDEMKRQRGDVKRHEEHYKHGRVKKLFTYEGFGFLETPEGEEIYFHRNAVLGRAFERLAIGAKVTFVEEMGDQGPQASSVALRS